MPKLCCWAELIFALDGPALVAYHGRMNLSRRAVFLTLFFLLSRLALAEEVGTELSRIPRVRVQSSNVASVGYSRTLQALEIEFTRGAVYRFFNVRPIVYRELLAAQSKGHFIAEQINGKYFFVHMRPTRAVASHNVRSTGGGGWLGE